MFERVWWKPWTWIPVGSISYREPEFVPAQVDWLLAHRANESVVRGPHGLPMSEVTDPANQFAYEASRMPTMDHAAAALGAAQDLYYKGKDGPRHGHLWGVHKRSAAQ